MYTRQPLQGPRLTERTKECLTRRLKERPRLTERTKALPLLPAPVI